MLCESLLHCKCCCRKATLTPIFSFIVCCLSLISFSSFLSSAPYGAAPYVFSTWISLGHVSRQLALLSIQDTYSSVRGVIFFSSTSSSAKFFWYFSQLEPVALGMFAVGEEDDGGCVQYDLEI